MAVLAFRLKDGRGAALGLRPDSTSLSVDDIRVSSYDLAGRPYVLVRDSPAPTSRCSSGVSACLKGIACSTPPPRMVQMVR